MKNQKTIVSLIALTAFPLLTSASTIVVNDSTWSSPASNTYVGGGSELNYYGSSGSSGNLSLTGDSSDLLTLTTGTGGRGLSLVFPTVSLTSPGQSMTVSVTFSIGGPIYTSTSTNFRFALDNNTGGTPITANGYGNTNAIFEGYTGYMLANSINVVDTTPTRILKKQPTANAIIGTTSGFDTLASGGTNLTPDPTPALTAALAYTATMTVTALADGVNIAYTLSGSGVGTIFNFDADDTSSPVSSFNTLAMHVNSNTWDTTQLQNVSISVVPEPTTYAALAGLTTLALALILRRRR